MLEEHHLASQQEEGNHRGRINCNLVRGSVVFMVPGKFITELNKYIYAYAITHIDLHIHYIHT